MMGPLSDGLPTQTTVLMLVVCVSFRIVDRLKNLVLSILARNYFSYIVFHSDSFQNEMVKLRLVMM